jgi:hypothetical protein
VIPAGAADFQLLAFSLFPLRFAAGAQSPMRISVPEIQALPSSFEPLGYDLPSQSESHFFECSPLSCNAMAREILVNSHCLLDDLATAVQTALRFSVEQPEPGAYFVVLVHRSGDPAAVA